MIPPLRVGTDHLPVGRYAATLDEVAERFVFSDDVAASTTRMDLWEQWETHRYAVEAATGEISHVWLAGSFVSSKMNPSDIDVLYAFRAEVWDRIPKDDLQYVDNLLTRDWCVHNGLRIDAYGVRLPTYTDARSLLPSVLDDKELESFQFLGIYDEFWQRCKCDGIVGKHRGYLEVEL